MNIKLMLKCSLIALICLSLCLLCYIYLISENTIYVETKNGLIKGERVVFDGRDVNLFLGIPYAEPPIGELRFKKPIPVGQWSQPIETKSWPKNCFQPIVHQLYYNREMSEDCLYLNIWSPHVLKSNDSLKPVMFWIHGGGLTLGSSSEQVYSGHVLASKGDVVVVTFNYRLNIFGFLYSGSDEAPGNMGLWDQAMALQWVINNIESFGGDSNRITVFGESAGGWSTSLLIISPVTRNMFQNAIVMSGAVIDTNQLCQTVNNEAVDKIWLKNAKSIGCSDGQSSDALNAGFTPKLIDCLRNISAEKLYEMNGLNMNLCMNQIVIVGQFLTKTPMQSFKSSDFKKNLNLMIGTVEDEGSWTLPIALDSMKHKLEDNITFTEAYDGMKKIFTVFPLEFRVNGEDVAKLYFSELSNNSNADLLRLTMGIAFGDYTLSCPTILFAKNLFANDRNASVYQYYYSSKLGADKLFCEKWMGVCHFDEIYAVFGQPFIDYNNYVNEERDISAQMIDMFSTFAKTGKPSKQKGVEWNQYYTIGSKIIAPYYEISSESKAKTNFGIGLKINECDYLWKPYLERE